MIAAIGTARELYPVATIIADYAEPHWFDMVQDLGNITVYIDEDLHCCTLWHYPTAMHFQFDATGLGFGATAIEADPKTWSYYPLRTCFDDNDFHVISSCKRRREECFQTCRASILSTWRERER